MSTIGKKSLTIHLEQLIRQRGGVVHESPKVKLRRQAKEHRGRLPLESINRGVAERLASMPVVQNTSHIMLFYPFGKEISVLELMKRFPDKVFSLPRINERNELSFHFYSRGDELLANHLHIPEPRQDAKLYEPQTNHQTVIIVPCLAADYRGYRLGYGQSFYDRYLARYGAQLNTVTVVADELVMEQIPVDPWDIAMDWVVTEHRVITPQVRI